MMEPGPPLSGGNPDVNVRGQMGQAYKFTPEEQRALRECNQESFYQRCLPFGAILAGTTWFGVKNNTLKPHPKYGPAPKMMLAVVVGYFLGKFSYQQKCADKLMKLPNSPVGEMLRKRRRGHLVDTNDPTFGAGMSLAPFSSVNPSDVYSDSTPTNSLDIDTTRPDLPGLEDYQRPSLDNPIYEEEMPPEQKHMTSYDELRKKNREEYQQKRVGVYREPIRQSPVAPTQSSGADNETASAPKNKYGDVWG